MLILCGFPVSNYYNKVKIALLEKGLAFEERVVTTPIGDSEMLAHSPMGKVPFLITPHGAISESQVILEYIEALAPSPALVPSDPFQAAKVRELCTYLDLHLELVVRELFGMAFFKAPALSEGAQARVKKLLDKAIPAFKGLAKFSPYVAGEQFSMADCSAFSSLPVLSMATKIVYGQDLLEAHGIDHKTYLKTLSERPSLQRVIADRRAYQATLAKKD
jgi:glutathione S-transferase